LTRFCARCGQRGNDRTTKLSSGGELFYCRNEADCVARVERDVAVNGEKVVECTHCDRPVKRRHTRALYFDGTMHYFEDRDSENCKAARRARTEANNAEQQKRQEEWLAKERAERPKEIAGAILSWLIAVAVVGWIIFSYVSDLGDNDDPSPPAPGVVVDVSDGEPDCAFGGQGVPISSDPHDLDRDNDGRACE
jgi:hypothetical protein